MDWEKLNAKPENSTRLLGDFTFAEANGEIKKQNCDVVEILPSEVIAGFDTHFDPTETQ